MASRNVQNTLVSIRRNTNLAPDELRDIKSLFVKLGKIGGYVRSRGKSEVWKYYGELQYKDASGNAISVDCQRHYCSPCLEKQQTPSGRPASQIGHLSQIQPYTLSTATSTLIDHLRSTLDIKLSKIGHIGYSKEILIIQTSLSYFPSLPFPLSPSLFPYPVPLLSLPLPFLPSPPLSLPSSSFPSPPGGLGAEPPGKGAPRCHPGNF
jgi:hypothetical protein